LLIDGNAAQFWFVCIYGNRGRRNLLLCCCSIDNLQASSPVTFFWKKNARKSLLKYKHKILQKQNVKKVLRTFSLWRNYLIIILCLSLRTITFVIPGNTISSSDPWLNLSGLISHNALGLSRVATVNSFLLRFGNENTWIWFLKINQ